MTIDGVLMNVSSKPRQCGHARDLGACTTTTERDMVFDELRSHSDIGGMWVSGQEEGGLYATTS